MSRWCFRCLVGLFCVAFVVHVIAYAARMRAQEGGGALIVLCAVVSCDAVRVLLGVAAVGVRVMMCVRLCSFLPLFKLFVTCWCGRAVAYGRVMARVVVQRLSSCDHAARLCFPCVGRCNRLFVVASLVVLCALAV